MGRIRKDIKVNGHTFWTLFDTGARNTYVVPRVASLLTTTKLGKPFRARLGGTVKKTTEAALLVAQVQGHRIATNAMVVKDIGKDEEGKSIQVLFGALAMQQWGIRPIPDEERLDLTHYPKEFVEF
jgi:Aspartyl protease